MLLFYATLSILRIILWFNDSLKLLVPGLVESVMYLSEWGKTYCKLATLSGLRVYETFRLF